MARWLLAWCLVAAGCSVESDPPPSSGGSAGSRATDGGGSAPTPPTRSSGRLMVDGDPMVRLGLSETVDLRVQVLNDDDEPRRRQTVSFNLVGRAEDSSLSSLVDTTDSEGIASVTLRAASRPATFEVRGSIDSERTVTFSVSVSGAGFGTLVVHAPYDGVRAVSERFVLALPNVTCDDAAYATGDPKTVIAPGENSATLVALPAEVPYAVLAVAQSASGITLARGCEDQRCQRAPVDAGSAECEPLVLRAQTEEELTVPFADLPLTPAPALSLEVTLAAGSTAAALGSAIRSAINGIVRTSDTGQNVLTDAEGRFWLDSLDAELRADEENAAALAFADELAEARLEDGNGPESSLSALLQVNDEGPGAAASAMASYVRDALDSLTLHAELEYARGGKITVRPLKIEGLPVADDPKPRASLLDVGAPEVEARLSDRDDTLRLDTFRFEPRLGALAADALERMMAADGSGAGAALSQLAGCNSLDEWRKKLTAATYPSVGACDEGCIERTCERAMSRILDAADDALAAIDAQRPHATLSGSLMLTDDDGDLRAEQMSTDSMEGLWEPAPNASLGDSLRGTAIARLPE